MKDLRNNNKLMGGVTVLLAGDFRQTLPVVKRAYLHGKKDVEDFSKILLDIGNGRIPELDNRIVIPENIGTLVSNLDELTESIYSDIKNSKELSSEWLSERAILTTTNEKASIINIKILDMLEGEEVTYSSIDSVVVDDDIVNFPTEFLNTLNPPGMSSHKLVLKVGAPIILIRNLNPPQLCNGTRLQIISLQRNIIEAKILTGCGIGETVFIPRIPIISADYNFEFKRIQYPIKLCFVMTINKSQGQTLKIAGLDLSSDCFSHGQFYVGCSRVSDSSSLFIYAPEDGTTRNLVYKEALS
ncbi:ATP-dependent DNA helicase pif1-like [Microplitis mediator]|uniref:ATP-dependent DNA helicase pif1-like n=1 Tax=Microplitis mediator TaxID=375433 RepID=UPI0025579617|nr:ATP-dependent DNA helicase pif1-like [Microplitis mediator]